MTRDRREFLTSLGGWAAAVALTSLNARTLRGESTRGDGYGPLRPTADEATGLALLELPEGFRYRSFGWTGDPLACGTPTPGVHDGMAAFDAGDGIVRLVRNHELNGDGGSFGKSQMTYDPQGPAGCTTLEFDGNQGEWRDAWCAISGTSRNCAGGPTPWGTWLTCEETTMGPGDVYNNKVHHFEKTHGWIFEVPTAGVQQPPEPLKEMGRFWHEAIAVDPQTGIVYETEDRTASGFFRFIPNKPSKLAEGGRLEMMKVRGRQDMRKGVDPSKTYDVSWVPIDDPEQVAGGGTSDQGVYHQGKAQGGATFARLEGCWHSHVDHKIYFDATTGGDKEKGQIWSYDPKQEQLRLVYESPGKDILDMPDNICVSPQGSILLCEDGTVPSHRIHGLTLDGKLFTLAANNVDLRSGERPRNVEPKDFRNQEWAGATFSPDGKWLFANIQNPGITFAITGPWEDGLI